MKATQIVIGEQEVFGSFNGLMIASRNLRHLKYFDVKIGKSLVIVLWNINDKLDIKRPG